MTPATCFRLAYDFLMKHAAGIPEEHWRDVAEDMQAIEQAHGNNPLLGELLAAVVAELGRMYATTP